MSGDEQVVLLAPGAVSFTASCELCAEVNAARGLGGSSFAGRLDLDLGHGVFLCRRGHAVHVVRAEPVAGARPASAAA